MERFELDEALKEEIRSRVLGEGFMKIVQSVRRGGRTFRISMRPVEIGGARLFQAEMAEDGQVQVKNLGDAAAAEGLEEIIAQRGAREMHLMTAKGDLHVRVTKKGHVLVSRSAEMDRAVVVRPHDRVKRLPLSSFDSSALLSATGIADGEGKVRSSMRGKYDQVNEFLKVVGETLDKDPPASFTVVDCGCGKSYLTFALWYYLAEAMKYPNVKVVGVDRRADVIAASRRTAERLDLAGQVEFVESDLAEYGPAGFHAAGVRLVGNGPGCNLHGGLVSCIPDGGFPVPDGRLIQPFVIQQIAQTGMRVRRCRKDPDRVFQDPQLNQPVRETEIHRQFFRA